MTHPTIPTYIVFGLCSSSAYFAPDGQDFCFEHLTFFNLRAFFEITDAVIHTETHPSVAKAQMQQHTVEPSATLTLKEMYFSNRDNTEPNKPNRLRHSVLSHQKISPTYI